MNTLQEAEHAHRQGNCALAKAQYEKYLIEHPCDAEAYHAFGILLAQLKEYDQSLEKINRAIALKPNQDNFYNNLGNVFLHLKLYDKASEAYKKAIKINPHYAAAYNNLGTIFYRQEKYIAAEKSYQKAIELRDNYIDANNNLVLARFQLGKFYFKNNDFIKAIGYFEWVLTQHKKLPEINQHLANSYLGLGDHEKALNYYFRQITESPLAEAYYNIGVLLARQEKLNDAVHYFKKADEQDPGNIDTQLNLGAICLKLNKMDQAVLYYQQANQLEPNNAEIAHILSALTQNSISLKAPTEYLTHLFDHYASHYDQHLTKMLHYDVPAILLKKIELEYAPAPASLRILDLGCGTGLAGEQFKQYASKLIGIDIADKMITIARSKNIYDQLITGDIESTIVDFVNINLIIAADVFTYIGDLDLIFSRVFNALIKNGLFVFSVERCFDQDFILQPSIRYMHSKNYLQELALRHGFTIKILDNAILRQQQNKPVEGYVVLLEK